MICFTKVLNFGTNSKELECRDTATTNVKMWQRNGMIAYDLETIAMDRIGFGNGALPCSGTRGGELALLDDGRRDDGIV